MKRTDYSTLADKYAAHRRPHPVVLARLADGLGDSSRALEVGCGTGNYAAALHDAKGCSVTGLDPSPEMLSKLRQRNPRLHAVEGRAESLPFPGGAFELLYSVDVIHHVADRSAAFAEAFRVLSAASRVCVVTDSEWILRNRAPQSVYFPETVDVELVRYPRIEILRAEMTRAGFTSLREEMVEHSYTITDASAYRDKVFSSLLYISDEAFNRGLSRMETDLARGPIECVSRYLLLWAGKA